MNKKGSINLVLILLVIILAGVIGYLTFVKKIIVPIVGDIPPNPIEIKCDADNNARIEIINTFSKDWSKFEKNLKQRPVLGSTVWGNPNNYQFIGNNRMFIAFEDGHVALASVVQYKCDQNNVGEFSNLEIFGDSSFSKDKWTILYDKYGDKSYGIHSYTKSIFRGGEIVRYDNWTEIPKMYLF